MADSEDRQGQNQSHDAEGPARDDEATLHKEPLPSTEEQPKGKTDPIAAVLPYVIYAAVLAFPVLSAEPVQQFLTDWWHWLAVGAAVVAFACCIPAVRNRVRQASPAVRGLLFVVFVIPLILFAVGAVVFLPATYQVPAIRSVFLLAACLLPGAMYYLFIVSKRHNLLNEYVSNLEKLGIFRRGSTLGFFPGSRRDRLRIVSYLEKFEAVYGPLPAREKERVVGYLLGPDLVDEADPRSSLAEPPASFTEILTPVVRFPLGMATLLIALGWLLVLPPWQGSQFEVPADFESTPQTWRRALSPEPTPVNFAFLGAYFFSLQMLFRRYVRKDLSGTAYVAVSLRIILAVVGTWAVVAALGALPFLGDANGSAQAQGGEARVEANASPNLLLVGFAIGVFPRVVWQVIETTFQRIVGLWLPSFRTHFPLSDLDGLTVWHETRLEEEDIETVPNMATADIVELMLHTRFPANRIIDWVDQAILYTHIGPSATTAGTESTRERLRKHGISTATALIEAYHVSKTNHQDTQHLEAILNGANRSPVRSLVDVLATSPNLALVQAWKQVPSRRSAVGGQPQRLVARLEATPSVGSPPAVETEYEPA